MINQFFQGWLARYSRDHREILAIQSVLPGVTQKAVREFAQSKGVGLTTIRVWACQGTLKVEDGQIVRVTPGPVTTEEIRSALRAVRQFQSDWQEMGVDRVHKYYSDVEGDWLENFGEDGNDHT